MVPLRFSPRRDLGWETRDFCRRSVGWALSLPLELTSIDTAFDLSASHSACRLLVASFRSPFTIPP